MSSALVMLHDQRSVLEMVKHITDAGVMDIYSKIPEDFSEEMHSDWEDEYAQEQQQHSAGEGQQQHSVGEEQQQHSEEQQENVGANEQQHTANAEEQQQKAGAEDHMEEPEPWQFSNMYYHPESNISASDDEVLEHLMQEEEKKTFGRRGRSEARSWLEMPPAS